MSRPPFCCQLLILGHNSFFMLRLKIVLSFHCHVATWNLGRDLIISFMSEIYVVTLKICRDFNSAPPVTTSLLGHNIFKCSTHSYCRNINSRSRPWLESSTYIFVATWNCLGETLQVHSALLLVVTLKRCRDIIFLEVTPALVSASSLMSQQYLFALPSLLVTTLILGRDLLGP